MILKKDNEQLAREKWEKLFSRDQMLDEPGQVLMTLPATPETIEVPRKQFRAVIKSAP